jgi:hypothetical protein
MWVAKEVDGITSSFWCVQPMKCIWGGGEGVGGGGVSQEVFMSRAMHGELRALHRV